MEALKEIRKYAFKNGLILGVLLLFLDLFTLYILAGSGSIAAIILSYFVAYLVIPLTVAVLLIQKIRAAIGSYWSFRQATSGIFILLFTAYLFSSAGSFIYIRYIDPAITLKAKDNLVDVFSTFMEKLDANQEKIDESVQNIESQFEAMSKNGFSSFFSNMISSVIVLFIVALILAAIFKRENPLLKQDFEK